MQDFDFGPFSFGAGGLKTVNGQSTRSWTLSYGSRQLAVHHIDAGATRSAVIEMFRSDMRDLISRFQRSGASAKVLLLEYESGKELASFPVAGGIFDGMTPGIPDASSRLWLVTSSHPVRSMRVTLTEFAALAQQHMATPNEWMQAALPGAVLTLDPAEWRAPTAWEIRHVVGEGSLTGITGAKAAELVGVLPQNFRKYTARNGSASRQAMSFAMWHLLLQRLGVQRI